MSGPCNHIYHCSYPVERFENGRSTFDGEIRGNDEAYHVRGGRTYSPTALSTHASISGHWRVMPVVGLITVKGRFARRRQAHPRPAEVAAAAGRALKTTGGAAEAPPPH